MRLGWSRRLALRSFVGDQDTTRFFELPDRAKRDSSLRGVRSE